MLLFSLVLFSLALFSLINYVGNENLDSFDYVYRIQKDEGAAALRAVGCRFESLYVRVDIMALEILSGFLDL